MMSPVITAQKQKENTSAKKVNYIQSHNNVKKPVARRSDPVEIIQKLRKNPDSLTRDDIVVLQNTIGNMALGKLLSEINARKEQKKEEQGKDRAAEKKAPDMKALDQTHDKNEAVSQKVPGINKETEKQQTKDDNVAAVRSETGQPQSIEPFISRKLEKTVEQPGQEQVKQKLNTQKTDIDNKSHEIVSPKKNDIDQDNSAPVAKGEPVRAAATKSESVRAPAIKVNSEEPGKILNSLAGINPTEAINAFSQAAGVSDSAFEKQRTKVQADIPEVPAPTGIPATIGPAKLTNKAKQLPHKAVTSFKSEKSGGKVSDGMPGEFNVREGDDIDTDEVMQEAQKYSRNTPGIGMTGEADPGQMDGFRGEASENAEAAKQAQLARVSQDFGENGITPKEDNTKLKASKPLSKVPPLGIDITRTATVSPEVASRVDPQLGTKLKSFLQGKESEFQKGKTEFDAGVVNAKANSNAQIESHKVQAKETQLKEQANAKSQVGIYREQWKNEIHAATAEYDKDANTEVEKKMTEVGNIKKDKEKDVKKTLSDAEKDAGKECKSARKEADEEKKKGEEKPKGFFGKVWDGVKKVGKAIYEGVAKAICFVFDKLRKAVKFIFEKAKQAAMALLEAGRRLIVSAIKGLGTILKGLVKTLLAKFPGMAKKICDTIDKVVNKAVQIVNKAADLLKKGVAAALDFLAKTVDGLLVGMEKLYKGIMSAIKTFLTMDFKKILAVALEAAEIAAEIALAFATGGGSVLLQIIKWLTTTLPALLRTAGSVVGIVNTIKNIKPKDVLKLLTAAGIAGFLTKGLFGELTGLPKEGKDEKEEKDASAGGTEKGLAKVLHTLMAVFNVLKGVYGKVAGGVSKVLSIINISIKPWFETFSAIYAGAVKAMDVVGNPAEALSEGAGKLKEAVGGFFGSIKGKLKEVAGSIKEKAAILGKPAQLMKLIANKAIDMVLNFIISHPPSALIKAVFKGIEAIAGKSIVELVRQYIPFADKLFDKIAGSPPVQGLMAPLQGPINSVGGMIDQATDGASGMVDNAEKSATATLGNSSKLLTNMGKAGGGKGEGKADDKGGDKKDGDGDFLGVLLSGVHTKLLAIGLRNMAKLGKSLASKVAGGAKAFAGKMLTPKVKFKLGNESHELWVEKGKNKNVVMMASNIAGPVEEKISVAKNKENVVKSKIEVAQQNPNLSTVNGVIITIKESSAGVSGVDNVSKKRQVKNKASNESVAKIKNLMTNNVTELKNHIQRIVNCGEYWEIQDLEGKLLKVAKKDIPSKNISTIKNIENENRKNLRSKYARKNMAGKVDENGVKFDDDGYPIFDSHHDMNLESKDYFRSRSTHFSRASKDFAKRIEKDPSIKEKLNLTDKEIEQFKDGDVPVRFTWHHHQDTGKMQLVDYDTHKEVYHGGGFSVWGPGN